MPWIHAIFTDTAREKIAEHGISEEEVKEVLEEAGVHTTRRSSGLPLAQGRTARGVGWSWFIASWTRSPGRSMP